MPHSNQHFQFHSPFVRVNKEMKEIYAHRTIEHVAVGMIAIFVPIYFLELGLAFKEIMLYMIVAYGSLAFLSPFFAILISKVGFKKSTISRPFSLILFFLMLYSLPESGINIYLIGLWWGMTNSWYWTSMNALTGVNLDKKKQAQEMSYNAILGDSLNVIGPIIGGVALLYVGFHALFVVVCIILLFSLIPLFLTPEYKTNLKLDFKPALTYRNFRYSMGLIATGIRYAAGGVILPLYLYFISNSTASVGLVYALFPAAAVTTMFFAGKIADKSSKHKMLRLATPFYSILWLALLFTRDIYLISLIFTALGLVVSFIYVPFNAKFYMRAKEKNANPLKLVIMHEMGLGVGRLILFGLCYFALDPYTTTMITTALGSWLYLFV
ncbi:MAG: MFS transporter [Candidatus Diapherotrites archaeon]|nr:MFS transporter [Candidatus Diapherotrites archaeon]